MVQDKLSGGLLRDVRARLLQEETGLPLELDVYPLQMGALPTSLQWTAAANLLPSYGSGAWVLDRIVAEQHDDALVSWLVDGTTGRYVRIAADGALEVTEVEAVRAHR